MRRTFLLACAGAGLAAAVSSPAAADPQFDACVARADGVMPTMGECGGEWVEREDKRLNAAWKALMAVAADAAKPRLLAEQRAWLAYRDASCEFWQDEVEYGQIGRYLNWPNCRATIVGQRIRNLKDATEAMEPR